MEEARPGFSVFVSSRHHTGGPKGRQIRKMKTAFVIMHETPQRTIKMIGERSPLNENSVSMLNR